MKATKMVLAFILICSFISSGQAAGTLPTTDPAAPLMEVVYNGVEGDYLLFTVKATVATKAFFVIKNEMGDDLHRELCYEGNNVRRIRIQKNEIRSIHFILSQKKKQCSRTFKVNTQIQETVNVLETTR